MEAIRPLLQLFYFGGISFKLEKGRSLTLGLMGVCIHLYACVFVCACSLLCLCISVFCERWVALSFNGSQNAMEESVKFLALGHSRA